MGLLLQSFRSIKLLSCILFAFLFSATTYAENITYEYRKSDGTWSALGPVTFDLAAALASWREDPDNAEFIIVLSAASQQFAEVEDVRNFHIDGVPVEQTPWHFGFQVRSVTYPFNVCLFVTDGPEPELHAYWDLNSHGYFNNYEYDENYRWTWTDQEGNETTTTVTVPPLHNVQISGLLHQNWDVQVWVQYDGKWISTGRIFAVLHEVEYAELPDEIQPHHIISEGLTPPNIPNANLEPEWPEAPGFIDSDDRQDHIGEDYADILDADPQAEASNDEIVAAIRAHDENRKEEQVSNEHLWSISEDNQNTRFDQLADAQDDQHDELVAWLEQIHTTNSSGLANTANNIQELRYQLDGIFGQDGDGGITPDFDAEGEGLAPGIGEGEAGPDFSTVADDVDGILGSVISAMPVIDTLPTVSGRKYTFDINIGEFKGANFDCQIDLTPFQSTIELLRLLFEALILIGFSVASIRIIKGGFAGE